MNSVLIIEDQPGLRRTLELVLQKAGFAVASLPGGEELSAALDSFRPDVVITDLKMEPVSGMEVLRRVRQVSPSIEVIMMTAFGTIDSAVEAMKLGATDYITKPFNNPDIVTKVKIALERKAGSQSPRTAIATVTDVHAATKLIATSSAMQNVMACVERLAPTGLTVLITGETGTGKTLIARLIHLHSPLARGPFVTVNSAALPEPLLETELFGHEKGAFTGATGARKGLFEEANGGTIFLDEIGALPSNLQSKLLAVLQDREVRRIGGNRTVPLNLRIIAASNKDLERAVARGEFRHDLFYRLNVARIHVRPLRERTEDISHLLNYFLRERGRRKNLEFRLNPQAMSTILRYPFPGNVRELENAVEWMTTVATDPLITEKDLPDAIRRGPITDREAEPTEPQEKTLDAHEKDLILQAIAQHRGNFSEVARTLGIGRTTLWRKMRDYDIRK